MLLIVKLMNIKKTIFVYFKVLIIVKFIFVVFFMLALSVLFIKGKYAKMSLQVMTLK